MDIKMEETPEQQDKGFTLVELLIVIVILGILATVTVFAVRGITDKGQENACSVEKRTLETAVEAYYAKYGADPASFAVLTPEFVKSDTTSGVWTLSGNTVSATAGGKCA
jgi:general secretion pathway protein G